MCGTALPAIAQKTRTGQKRITQPRTELVMGETVADAFESGVRLRWQTELEQNIVGFRLWRDENGFKVAVDDQMRPGSIAKVRGDLLRGGDEYVAYDPSGAVNSSYWIESVDLNSSSRWFGPYYASAAFGDDEKVNAAIAGVAGRQRETQTEYSVNLEGKTSQALETESAGLLAGDGNALKMFVRERGIYRVTADALASFGFTPSLTANWRMFNGGVERPIKVNDDASIEFYGEGIDTLQTDANVYWLTDDSVAGTRINRSNSNYINSARDGSSRVIVEKRERSMRISSALNGDRENWFGSYVSNTVISRTLNLRDIDLQGNQTATVAIDLQGISNIGHQISVKLNGNAIGNFSFPAYDRKEWSTTVPVSALVEGANVITVQGTNTTSDFSLTESFRITYPRLLKAADNKLEFLHDSSQAVRLRNFSSSTVRIFDVTNPSAVTETAPESRLESDGSYSVTVPGTSSPRSLFVLGEPAQPLTIDPLIPNIASDLRNPLNEGRLIMITTQPMMKALYSYRDNREYNGLRTKIVDIEDIYDEFNNGIKSAGAIKSFLQFAKQNWAIKPDYVILAGESSSDPRNYSGLANESQNSVPTVFVDTWNIEAPSDEMLVDFTGDSLGEIAVGRLPAQDRDELSAMAEKLEALSGISASEIAGRGVAFVSDDNLGYNFANSSREMASTIPGTPNITFFDRAGQDPTSLRGQIVTKINSGVGIVNFFGHGSITSWTSAGLLRNVDASSMFNTKKPTMIVSLACLNGDSTVFGVQGFAEAMMKRNRGGAHTVWAASGWNGAYEEDLIGRDLYPRIFAGMRLGDAVREVKSRYPTVDMRRTFILYGDPSMRFDQSGN